MRSFADSAKEKRQHKSRRNDVLLRSSTRNTATNLFVARKPLFFESGEEVGDDTNDDTITAMIALGLALVMVLAKGLHDLSLSLDRQSGLVLRSALDWSSVLVFMLALVLVLVLSLFFITATAATEQSREENPNIEADTHLFFLFSGSAVSAVP